MGDSEKTGYGPEQGLLGISDPIPPTETAAAVNSLMPFIRGDIIDQALTDLAAIGGKVIEPTPEQPVRYATNRLALSETDKVARDTFVKPMMESADMEVLTHPFGLIGISRGRNQDLPPIVVMSHTDTVPGGEKYDGNYGVISGILAAKALKNAGVKLERDLYVVSLTGEESSRFRFACFGSEAMFLGLNDKQLQASDKEGITIADAVGSEDIDKIRNAIFGPRGNILPTPEAVIELHVSQDKRLEQLEADLAVVDSIAAPQRFEIKIGEAEPLEPAQPNYPNSRHFTITVNGRADHSGATPMTPGARHDGLLITSELISEAFQSKSLKDHVAIGNIDIESEALNKIPGISKTSIRISGNSDEEIEQMLDSLRVKVDAYNETGDNSCSIEELEETGDKSFFDPREIIGRQLTALMFVRAVNAMAGDPNLVEENIVGTIGTFNTGEEGLIRLGLDIRGTYKESRDQVIYKIRTIFELMNAFASVEMGEPLVGSGDPVKLDEKLVERSRDVIDKYEIGKAVTMHSAAGHDAQNAAKAGVPTVMLFVPSRDGIAHNPEAYTSPIHLEKGAKALAALVVELASK